MVTGPVGSGRQPWCDPFEQCDQQWVTPGAIARRAHYLPIRAVGGQRHRTLQTTPLIGADRLGRSSRRAAFGAKGTLRSVRRQMCEHGGTARRLLRRIVLGRGTTRPQGNKENDG